MKSANGVPLENREIGYGPTREREREIWEEDSISYIFFWYKNCVAYHTHTHKGLVKATNDYYPNAKRFVYTPNVYTDTFYGDCKVLTFSGQADTFALL